MKRFSRPGYEGPAYSVMKTIAQKGPLSREDIFSLVGPMIPPESAVRSCLRKRGPKNLDHDTMVSRGRQVILNECLHGMVNSEGSLEVNGDGLHYPTAKALHESSELFMGTLKSPLLRAYGLRLAAIYEDKYHNQQSDSYVIGGLRTAMRELLAIDKEEQSNDS